MQVRSAEHQREDASNRFSGGKAKLPQQTKRDQRGQHIHQNVDQVADHDAAHGRIVRVFRKNGQVRDPGCQQIRRQHE